MKTLASEFTAELAAETAAFAFLLALELNTPLYRAGFIDIPVTTGGNLYTPINIEVDRIAAESGLAAGYIDITLDAVDQVLAAAVLNEDVAGRAALLSVAAIGDDYRVVRESTGDEAIAFGTDALTFGADPLTFGSGSGSGDDIVIPLFRGLIASWDLNEQGLKMTLVNELILWRKKTLRKCQVNCQWPFKSTECGYGGAETWCDQSYTRCTALSNTDNYGGFRFIQATMEKELRWGTV